MKILASIIKEWMIFRRDLAGVLVLLLMPAALIVIMALVQDAPFRDFRETRFELLVADEDGGSISKSIIDGLKKSGRFLVKDDAGTDKYTALTLKQELRRGHFHAGIIIPQGATAELINRSNQLANILSGTKALPARLRNDSISISIVFDPVAKPAFRTAIQFALERYINGATSMLVVHRMARSAGISDSSLDLIAAPTLPVRETPLDRRSPTGARLNSVQHNVPAWAIFGIFFILIPLSGQIIREREEGSAMRLALIPGAKTAAGLGKILFYTFICCIQALLMAALGIWILPMLGLPALTLGIHPFALIPVVIAIAFAGTSFGFFVGSFFRTANQALPFGAISMMMLSAIGGIWVPVEILPPLLQKAAVISPLHWGLEAVHGIILRNGSFTSVWKDVLALMLFGAIAWGATFFAPKKNPQTLNI